MGQVKFYKDGNVWLYNEGIDSSVDKTVPPGNYRKSVIDTTISIRGKESTFSLFSPDYHEVTEIQKSSTPDDNYASIAEFNTATDSFFSGQSTSLTDSDGKVIDVQNPLPTDGDSVYCKDLCLTNSDINDFSGEVCDLFDDYTNTSVAASVGGGGANPKSFLLVFKRPLVSSTVGVGSPDDSISNGKLTLTGLSGDIIKIVDFSTDDTKKGVQLFQFEQKIFISALIEFYTDDEVVIGGAGITKSNSVSIDAINGIISHENSTNELLIADAIFTGNPVDTKNYGIIVCSVYSDVVSATGGLIIEFSTDETNWFWNDTYTIEAAKGKTFSVQTQARYLRIRYINGSTGQATFQLETTLKPVYIKPSSHRIGDPISAEDDSELIKAVLTGADPNNIFKNVKVNLEQALSTTNFLIEVARGTIPGIKMYSIPGRKNALSTTVLDDLTQIPGITVVPEPGGIQLEVVSSSASDTSAGIGVQTLDIHYLDGSGLEQEETVTLDGLTPVDTIATDIDYVQWAHTKTVGTNGIAVGNISIRDTTGAITYEYIASGGNQSLSAKFKVPTAKVGYVIGWHCSGITKIIDLRLRATVERSDRSLVPGVFLFQDILVLGNSTSGWIPFEVPLKMPAGAVVKLSGISGSAGGDGAGEFDIVLIDD